MARASLPILVALFVCAGCGDRNLTWTLSADIDVESEYATPDNGPVAVFYLQLSGTDADTADLTFEYDLSQDGNFLPLLLAGASDGTVAGNVVYGVDAQHVRHSFEWDTGALGRTSSVIARIRVTLDDHSTHGDNNDGTATDFSKLFLIDNTALPDVALPVAPGTVSGTNADRAITLQVGDSLATSIEASSEQAGGNVDLTVRVVGGDLTAAATGFDQAFPQAASGAEPVTILLTGTALAHGTLVLELEVTDVNGTAYTRLTLTITNADPQIAAPANADGVRTGADPLWYLSVDDGDSLLVDLTVSDPEDQSVSFDAVVSGGSLTAAQAGFSPAFPLSVTGISPSLQLTGTTTASVGTIELTISADDGDGGIDTITLVVSLNNAVPEFGAPGDYQIERHPGDAAAFQVTATDADASDTLTLSATVIGGSITPAQAGITIPAQVSGNSPVALQITGTIAAAGTIIIRFDLDDGHVPAIPSIITLHINHNPVFDTPVGNTTLEGSDPSWTTRVPDGESINWSIGATDADAGDTLSISVTGITGDAAAAGFNPIVDVTGTAGAGTATLSITGVWDEAATIVVSLLAEDDAGGSATLEFTFVLRGRLEISDPTIAGLAGPSLNWTALLNVGDSLDFTIDASADGPGTLDTISSFEVMVTGGSPATAGFDALPAPVSGRSSQQLSFTGTAATPGLVRFNFVATDTFNASRYATLSITINSPPVFDTPTKPGTISGSAPDFTARVRVEDSLNFTIQASDADAHTMELTMSVTGGSLTTTEAGFTSVPIETTSGNPTLQYQGTAATFGTIELTFLADDLHGRQTQMVLTIIIVGFLLESFDASPARARIGEEITLDWSITGTPGAIRLEPGSVDVSGQSSHDVTPFPAANSIAGRRQFYGLHVTDDDAVEDILVPESILRVGIFGLSGHRIDLDDLARDTDGSLAVVGTFKGTPRFDPDGANNESLTSAAASGYLTIFAPDGSLKAVRQISDNFTSPCRDRFVTFLADGRILVVGAAAAANVVFSVGELDEITLPRNGFDDFYAACYSKSGKLLWARMMGGADHDDSANLLVPLPDGGFAIACTTSADIAFNVGEVGETTISGPNEGIAVFRPDGTLRRYIVLAADNLIGVSGMAGRPDGSLVVSGNFLPGAVFAPGQPGEVALVTTASAPYIAIFDSLDTGGQLSQIRTGIVHPNFGSCFPAALVAMPDDGFAITGNFRASLTLGLGQANEVTLGPGTATPARMFVAVYDRFGLLRWAKDTSDGNGTDGKTIAARPDGSVVVGGTFDGRLTFEKGGADELEIVRSGRSLFAAVYGADGTFLSAEVIADDQDAFCTVRETGDGGFLLGASSGVSVTLRPGEPDALGVSMLSGGAFVAHYRPVNFRLLEVRPASVNDAQAMGSTNDDTVRDIAAASGGATFVVGALRGALQADGAPGVNQTVSVNSRDDLLLVRYEADGSISWALSAGGAFDDIGNAVAVLPDGNVVVAGTHTSLSSVFGDGEANETTFTHDTEGDASMVVAVYDADTGELLWARTTSGDGQTTGTAVCALVDGRIVVAGRVWADVAVFASGEANETSIDATSADSWFVACYTADGDLDWASRVDDVGLGEVNRIASFGSGRIVLLGECGGASDTVFGPGEAGEASISTGGVLQVVLAAFEPAAGELQWVRQMACTSAGSAHGLGLTPDGQIVCSGEAGDTITLASGHASATACVPDDSRDCWLAWFTSAGAVVRVVHAPTTVRSVAVLPDGVVAAGGTLTGSAVVFGSGEAAETTLTPTGSGTDGWIAMWWADGSFAGASQVASDDGDTDESVAAMISREDGTLAVAGDYETSGLLIGLGEPNELAPAYARGGRDLFVARYHPLR